MKTSNKQQENLIVKTIEQFVRMYPNDADLGEAVRLLIKSKQKDIQ